MNNSQSLQNMFQEQQIGNPGLGISLSRQLQGPSTRPLQPFAPVTSVPPNVPPISIYSVPTVPSNAPHVAFSSLRYPAHTKSSSQMDAIVTMRSVTGMQGLKEAEEGGQFVQLTPAATKFCAGGIITPQDVTPLVQIDPDSNLKSNSKSSNQVILNRHPTLFTKDATIERKTAELNNVLGNASSGRLDSKARILPTRDKKESKFTVKRPISAPSTPIVSFEQAKSNARVELDLHLDSGVCVEGGYLKGKVVVSVRNPDKNQGPIYLGGGKARVIGFEAIVYNDQRNTFYHCSAPLENVSPFCHLLYASTPDGEGFHRAKEGDHELPFAMRLPPRPTNFPVAKGAYESKLNGSSIRYIAMVSIKMKDTRTDKRSVAHFYRTVEIWPIFDPKVILAASPTPLYATIAKPLFLGGSGTLKITASLHRAVWIAGQRCYVKIFIANDTEKRTVKALTLSLIRFETVFKPEVVTSTPSRQKSVKNEDAGQTSTVKRFVTQSILEMGEKATKRRATAKGWWTGVEPGAFYEFNHHILLPPFALTIPRSRLIEVGYILEVAVGTGPLASDVAVQLPVRIINYISIDPPPNCGPAERLRNLASTAMRPRGENPSNEAMVSQSTHQPLHRHPIPSSNAQNASFNISGNELAVSDTQLNGLNTGTYNGNIHMYPLGALEIRNPGPSMFVSPTTNASISASGVWIEQKDNLQKTEELQHALEESNEGLVKIDVEPLNLANIPGHFQQEVFQRESSGPGSQSNRSVGDDVLDHASLDDYEEGGLDKIIQRVNQNQLEIGEGSEIGEAMSDQFLDEATTQDGSGGPNESKDARSLGRNAVPAPLSDKSDSIERGSFIQMPDLHPVPSRLDGQYQATERRNFGATLPLRPVTVIGLGHHSVKPLPSEPLQLLELSSGPNSSRPLNPAAANGTQNGLVRLNPQRPQPRPRPLLTGKISKQTILTLERKRMSMEQSSRRGTGPSSTSNQVTLNLARRTQVNQRKAGAFTVPSAHLSEFQPGATTYEDSGLQPPVPPIEHTAHQQQFSTVDVPSSVSALLRQPLKTPKSADPYGEQRSVSPNEFSEVSGDGKVLVEIPPTATMPFERSKESGSEQDDRKVTGRVPVVGGPISIRSRIAMFEQGDNLGVVAPAFGGQNRPSYMFSNKGARVFRPM